MSATNVETVATAVAKKITLAGKYSKFLVCGFWTIDRLLGAGTIDEATADTARVELCIFAGPEKQNEMFDQFFAELKDSTKFMKSLIKEHNKPPKAKKVKVIKEKKPKASKKKPYETLSDPQDLLVAEIVAAAQSDIYPGDEIKSVVRKGAPAVPPNPLPLTAVEEPVKKAPVDAEAKKAAKALEAETKKTAKALEAETKKTAKAAEDEAKKTAKAAEDEAKKAAKALEAETKKTAKAAEDETKKAAKALESETKKTAKAAEDEAKKATKAAEDEAKKAAKKGAPAVPTPLTLTVIEAKKPEPELEPENFVQETQGAQGADAPLKPTASEDAAAKKAAKALEIETKKNAKAAEDEAKKTAKTAEDQAKKVAKAAEVAAKKAAKPAKNQKENKPVEPETLGSPEDDDQDTLNLRPISFPDGRNFLLDESNNYLYDPSCVDLDDFAPVATYRGNQWFPLTPSLLGLEA